MGRFCEKAKLTKPVVAQAGPVPTETGVRQRLLYDTALPGFGLCVGKHTKSFMDAR